MSTSVLQRETAEKSKQYWFTDDEMSQIARDTANGIEELHQVEDRKKQVMSQFKAEMESIQARINRNAARTRNGFEYRTELCYLIRNYKTYKREFFSVSTDDLIATEDFLPQDYQRQIVEEQRQTKDELRDEEERPDLDEQDPDSTEPTDDDQDRLPFEDDEEE